jgi:hypothetical protein
VAKPSGSTVNVDLTTGGSPSESSGTSESSTKITVDVDVDADIGDVATVPSTAFSLKLPCKFIKIPKEVI